jgi:Tol biopolymer transport system component
MMKKQIILMILIVLLIPLTGFATTNNDLQAAFIRNDDLWMKIGEKEIRLTNGEDIRYPKWSFDGSLIAYLKGSNQTEFYNGELWVYNLKFNKHFKIKSNVNHDYQWSSKRNEIGFLDNKNLFRVDTELFNQNKVTPITSNVENFSWMPDGNGFLISSKESPQLDSDIILSTIHFRPDSQKPVIKPLYTVPVDENEYFISTSKFKWSNDKKWISFLLVPTASLSADSNTLCIMSNDGRVFQRTDEMLNAEDWFQWAPSESFMGYISGVGREATSNKKLKVLAMPSMEKVTFTPKGYVDRDLTWQNNRILYVSRSKESTSGKLNQRPLPSLYKIHMANNKQIKLTNPPEKEGDFRPQYLTNKLIWIRTDRQTANVLYSPVSQLKEDVWIQNINLGSSYYEKWSWDEVFSVYNGL